MQEEQNPDKIGPNPNLVTVFCDFFRAATRPAVTIIFAAVIAQVVVDRIDAPQWFIGLATACILWWFGDRTVQHIKVKKANQESSNSPS